VKVKRYDLPIFTSRVWSWLFFCVWATVCQSAIGQEVTAGIRKYAFVVGVSEYTKAGLDNLKFGAKDAADLKVELEKLGFIVTSLIGPEATQENIETRFDEFMLKVNRELGKEDVVLVYFSGHGLQKIVVNGEGQGAQRVETPFFCPSDGHNVDMRTLVSLNNIIDGLKASTSERNILLVDACRNNNDKGAGKGEPALNGSTVRDLPNKLSVLFSSRDGQKSWESDLPEVQQGVFTHVILEGLRGEAANNQGEIRWLGLANYVVENVPIQAERLAGKGTVQVPNLILNSGPQIEIGRVKQTNDKTKQPLRESTSYRLKFSGEFAQPGFAAMPGTINLEIDKEIFTGKVFFEDKSKNERRAFDLNGRIEDGKLTATTYFEGKEWSTWTCDLDVVKGTLKGSFKQNMKSPRARGPDGTIDFEVVR
jgi:hypothetical protein